MTNEVKDNHTGGMDKMTQDDDKELNTLNGLWENLGELSTFRSIPLEDADFRLDTLVQDSQFCGSCGSFERWLWDRWLEADSEYEKEPQEIRKDPYESETESFNVKTWSDSVKFFTTAHELERSSRTGCHLCALVAQIALSHSEARQMCCSDTQKEIKVGVIPVKDRDRLLLNIFISPQRIYIKAKDHWQLGALVSLVRKCPHPGHGFRLLFIQMLAILTSTQLVQTPWTHSRQHLQVLFSWRTGSSRTVRHHISIAISRFPHTTYPKD